MRKILFMLISMNIGGTEKALLNMLYELSKKNLDVTILLLEKEGEFLGYVPKSVNIECFDDYKKIKQFIELPPYAVTLNLIKKGRVVRAFKILGLYLICKVIEDRTLLLKYILKGCPAMSNNYDLAIAYAGPMELITYYVAEKIQAKNKVQWVHFDVENIGFNKKFAARMFNKFDKIFAVSTEGKNKLISILPCLRNKTKEFYNVISGKCIIDLAKEGTGFEDGFDGIRILTVGRLSREKGQDVIIPVLSRLINNGYNVKWYCVGDGSSRGDYEHLIIKYKVQEDFILLGSTPNPYPFMSQCDIYVQPSRHEGYCITLAEAKCFKKPIVCTDFTGANEQIIHGETGLIAKCNEKEIYNAVKELLDKKYLRETLSKNLIHDNVDTTKELSKLYELTDRIYQSDMRRITDEKSIIYG